MTILSMVTYENNIDLEQQVTEVVTNVTVIIIFYPHKSDESVKNDFVIT